MRYVSGMSAFMAALAFSAASPACAIAQATVLKVSGTCFMTMLLDGNVLCPAGGCNMSSSSNAPSISSRSGNTPASGVDIDQYINANDVSAIEVYARGGNTPISLQAGNSACGVIAIWTGSRR